MNDPETITVAIAGLAEAIAEVIFNDDNAETRHRWESADIPQEERDLYLGNGAAVVRLLSARQERAPDE